MVNVALLAGKVVFLVMLYLFIYTVVRSATRDLRAVGAVRVSATSGSAAVDLGPAPSYGPASTGTGGWALVAEQSPYVRMGWAFVVSPDAVMVAGRAADSDILLADTFVSSHHTRLRSRDDGLVVEDLGSTNGTYVNGEEIEAPTLVAAGDSVAIGDSVFRVEPR